MANAKLPSKGTEGERESGIEIKLNVRLDHSRKITPAGRAFAERRKAGQVISGDALMKQSESLDSRGDVAGFSFAAADDDVKARLKLLEQARKEIIDGDQ